MEAARLGIAITTFNRVAVLEEQLDRLLRFTSVPFDLVVTDDGSTDGTAEALRRRGVAHVAGRNKGIAWNKNRGLFHLMHRTDADAILLMDDDVVPLTFGWEQEWIAAARTYGHINFVPRHLRSLVLTGDCRAGNPGITHVIGGQCLGFTRNVLVNVGYFDPRFGQYGHEHSDVSFRCQRAGFGAFRRPYGEEPRTYFFVIDSGLELRDVPSHSNLECLDRNLGLLFDVANDPIHRLPWRSDGERAEFLEEFPSFGPSGCPGMRFPERFDPDRYLALNPDVAQSGQDPFAHFAVYGRSEGRRVD